MKNEKTFDEIVKWITTEIQEKSDYEVLNKEDIKYRMNWFQKAIMNSIDLDYIWFDDVNTEITPQEFAKKYKLSKKLNIVQLDIINQISKLSYEYMILESYITDDTIKKWYEYSYDTNKKVFENSGSDQTHSQKLSNI